MAIQGKVVNVSFDVDYPKKDGGGSYQAFVLKYVTERNEVREIVKPMQGLKYKPTIAKVLRELNSGDTFSLQMEKNKAGYDDIVALQKGAPGVELAAQAETGGTANKAGVSVPGNTTRSYQGNTYETPEERKLKQRLIVRQAALNQALNFLTIAKDPKRVTMEEVPQLAEQFENWVYRGVE